MVINDNSDWLGVAFKSNDYDGTKYGSYYYALFNGDGTIP